MKKLILFLLLPSLCFASSGGMYPTPMVYQGSSTPDYSDILFYHDADSLNTTPNKGSGSLTFDAGILLETTDPILSAGSWDNNNDGYDNVTIPLSGNLDLDSGRVGLYWRPNDETRGRIIYACEDPADFNLTIGVAADSISWSYKGANKNTAHGLSTFDGTHEYFVETSMDGSTATLYIDGVLLGSLSGSTAVTSTNICIGSEDGNVNDAMYDQIIFSSDTARDINAIKDNNSF